MTPISVKLVVRRRKTAVQPGLDMPAVNSRFEAILLELHALSEAKVVPGAAVVKFPRLSFTPEVHTLSYLRGHR